MINSGKKYTKPYCIVLDSEYSSMGRMIGLGICQDSEYTYYDKMGLLELLDLKDEDILKINNLESSLKNRQYSYKQLNNNREYLEVKAIYDKAIDIALSKGSCLIHDKTCKEDVVAKGYRCISIFIYANNIDDKIVRARVSPLYKDIESNEEIIKMIRQEDMLRQNYHNGHSTNLWADRRTYDLCINVDTLRKYFVTELLKVLIQ